jgi:hypothetical protein
MTHTDILALIEKLPASFWGVVVGSFFTLSGVALTNRASDKRLRNQFEHERQQIATDREMMLRKEIYLAAAETISSSINAIFDFSNADRPYKEISYEYAKKIPIVSKVLIIASAKTIAALNIFSTELGATYVRLSAPHFRLVALRQQIINHDNNINNVIKKHNRLLEMMLQNNLNDGANQRQFQILQDSFDFETKSMEHSQKKRSELAQTLYPQQLELMQECMVQIDMLSMLVIPVLAAVREELQLPFNEESYREGLINGRLKMKQAIDDFIQNASQLSEIYNADTEFS